MQTNKILQKGQQITENKTTMKRSLKKLLSFTIRDPENNKGRVKDFLLDEESWITRYLVVDFGPEFIGKRVLISNQFLEQPDWGVNTFPINKKKSDISQSPGIDDKMPVSRKYEEELNKHYKLVNYWDIHLPGDAITELYPPRPIKIPAKKISEKDIDSSLRSFVEIDGYKVTANNQDIGNIADVIVDDQDWQAVYLIIDTSKWLPWTSKVIVPIVLFDDISYVNNQISTQIDPEKIKNSPKFEENKLISRDFEAKVYDYFIEKK